MRGRATVEGEVIPPLVIGIVPGILVSWLGRTCTSSLLGELAEGTLLTLGALKTLEGTIRLWPCATIVPALDSTLGEVKTCGEASRLAVTLLPRFLLTGSTRKILLLDTLTTWLVTTNT